MGVAGIHIHGLKDQYGQTSAKGSNPFDRIPLQDFGEEFSTAVKCYDPQGGTSEERYRWIECNLESVIEKAIEIRKEYCRTDHLVDSIVNQE